MPTHAALQEISLPHAEILGILHAKCSTFCAAEEGRCAITADGKCDALQTGGEEGMSTDETK